MGGGGGTSGRSAMVRRVCMWQKGVISTGRGNDGPRPLQSLVSSTMQMNFLAITSTIFSRSSAPPPPLTSAKSGSTCVAPGHRQRERLCVQGSVSALRASLAACPACVAAGPKRPPPGQMDGNEHGRDGNQPRRRRRSRRRAWTSR